MRPSHTFELQEANPQPYTYPEEMDLSRNALLVAGIDFGTTFSGYAFATRVDFEKDPLIIHVPSLSSPSQGLISFKTPTTVLMDKNEEFVAFGFEAETKYAEYLEKGKGDDYFYFHHFKMLMYSHARVQVYNNIKIHVHLYNFKSRLNQASDLHFQSIFLFVMDLRYRWYKML